MSLPHPSHLDSCPCYFVGLSFEYCEVCVQPHSRARGCPIIPVPMVEKTILSPLCCLCFFVEDKLTVFVWGCFLALCPVPLVYLSTLSPIPYCPDDRNFTVSPEGGCVRPPTLFSSNLCRVFCVFFSCLSILLCLLFFID